MKLIFFVVLFILSQARDYERLMELLETAVAKKQSTYVLAEDELAGTTCDVKQASVWGGKIEATYTSCTGIPAAATFTVKVSEIVNSNCPLFQDWYFPIGCQGGICKIGYEFEVSFDACDLLAALATGGASVAAKQAAIAVGKQLGKQAAKRLTGKAATLAKAAGKKMGEKAGNKLKTNVRKQNAGGLCDGIEKSLGVALQCLFNADASIKIPGLREALDIFNAGISLSLEAKMEFNINTRRIQNVGISMGFMVKLSEAAPVTWGLTLLAKTIPEIPDEGCDPKNPFKIAKTMHASINFGSGGVSGQFVITCGTSTAFKTMEQVGKKLKEGAKEVEKAAKKAHGAAKNTLNQAKNGLKNVCKHVKSKKNQCHNTSQKVCGWAGRRQMDDFSPDVDSEDDDLVLQTDNDDSDELDVADFLSELELAELGDEDWVERRRSLLFGGRRRRRWVNPLKWICNNVAKRVCNLVDHFHC